MSELNLSDNEIKALLKPEGIESPSIDFNQSVLAKIEAAEKQKTKAVSAPKWLLILLGLLFIAPSLYFVFAGKSALTNPEKLQKYLPSVDTGLGSNLILIVTGILLIGGIAFILSNLGKRPTKKQPVKKG